MSFWWSFTSRCSRTGPDGTPMMHRAGDLENTSCGMLLMQRSRVPLRPTLETWVTGLCCWNILYLLYLWCVLATRRSRFLPGLRHMWQQFRLLDIRLSECRSGCCLGCGYVVLDDSIVSSTRHPLRIKSFLYSSLARQCRDCVTDAMNLSLCISCSAFDDWMIRSIDSLAYDS